MNVILFGKRIFADVIKELKRILGFSGALNAMEVILMPARRRPREDGGRECSHNQRASLEEAWKDSCLKAREYSPTGF